MMGSDLLSVLTLLVWRQVPPLLTVEVRDQGMAAMSIFQHGYTCSLTIGTRTFVLPDRTRIVWYHLGQGNRRPQL